MSASAEHSGADRAPATTFAELVRLTTIGAPVVAAQLAQMGMGLVDTLMLGRVSAGDLAGAALSDFHILATASSSSACSQ